MSSAHTKQDARAPSAAPAHPAAHPQRPAHACPPPWCPAHAARCGVGEPHAPRAQPCGPCKHTQRGAQAVVPLTCTLSGTAKLSLVSFACTRIVGHSCWQCSQGRHASGHTAATRGLHWGQQQLEGYTEGLFWRVALKGYTEASSNSRVTLKGHTEAKRGLHKDYFQGNMGDWGWWRPGACTCMHTAAPTQGARQNAQGSQPHTQRPLRTHWHVLLSWGTVLDPQAHTHDLVGTPNWESRGSPYAHESHRGQRWKGVSTIALTRKRCEHHHNY